MIGLAIYNEIMKQVCSHVSVTFKGKSLIEVLLNLLNILRDLPKVLNYTVLIKIGSFWPWILETGSLIETTLLCWLRPAENLSLQDVLHPYVTIRKKNHTSKSNQGGRMAMGLSLVSLLWNSSDRCPAPVGDAVFTSKNKTSSPWNQ